jgi:hypothetical protein
VYQERIDQNRFYVGGRGFYTNWQWPKAPAYGYHVWFSNNQCQLPNKDGKLVECDGCGAGDSCSLKFFSQESMQYGSDNGSGARHHPTRAQHLLRGEIMSWHMAFALLDALYMLRDEMSSSEKAKDSDSLIRAYADKITELYPAPPADPKYCGKYHCQSRPRCFTDSLPHYSNATLRSIVVGQPEWEYEPHEYGECARQQYE